MTTQTFNVVVQSTADQRFDPEWRATLVSVLSEGGAAVVDVGGGTDMSSATSDNEYEITGPDNVLQRSISALHEFGYRFDAFDALSGVRMASDRG